MEEHSIEKVIFLCSRLGWVYPCQGGTEHSPEIMYGNFLSNLRSSLSNGMEMEMTWQNVDIAWLAVLAYYILDSEKW